MLNLPYIILDIFQMGFAVYTTGFQYSLPGDGTDFSTDIINKTNVNQQGVFWFKVDSGIQSPNV